MRHLMLDSTYPIEKTHHFHCVQIKGSFSDQMRWFSRARDLLRLTLKHTYYEGGDCGDEKQILNHDEWKIFYA